MGPSSTGALQFEKGSAEAPPAPGEEPTSSSQRAMAAGHSSKPNSAQCGSSQGKSCVYQHSGHIVQDRVAEELGWLWLTKIWEVSRLMADGQALNFMLETSVKSANFH